MTNRLTTEARAYLEELLRKDPTLTCGELACSLQACACMGCPKLKEGQACECQSGARRACRCTCRVEPYATRNRQRQAWAFDIARAVKYPNYRPRA